jgi:hypothetical protein
MQVTEAGAAGIRQLCNSLACDADQQADVDAQAPDRAAGTNLMKYIALISVIGIVLIQATGSIPQASVGGAMTIALAFLVAALAVGIHEAWTKKRGVLGWIVNIVVALVGAFLAGQLSMEPILMLMPLEGSLAATGGPVAYVALAVMMLVHLLGAWGALWVVNRWR